MAAGLYALLGICVLRFAADERIRKRLVLCRDYTECPKKVSLDAYILFPEEFHIFFIENLTRSVYCNIVILQILSLEREREN